MFSLSWRMTMVALLAIAVGSSRAEAQPPERGRVLLGLGIGFGALTRGAATDVPDATAILLGNASSLPSANVELEIGTAITRNVVLMGGLWSASGNLSASDAAFLIPDRVVQVHATYPFVDTNVWVGRLQYTFDRLSVSGGFGRASLGGEYEDDDGAATLELTRQGGLAVLGSVGANVWRRQHFVVDLHARYLGFGVDGARINSIAVGAGFTWSR